MKSFTEAGLKVYSSGLLTFTAFADRRSQEALRGGKSL
jgi:hypothetical protein